MTKEEYNSLSQGEYVSKTIHALRKKNIGIIVVKDGYNPETHQFFRLSERSQRINKQAYLNEGYAAITQKEYENYQYWL